MEPFSTPLIRPALPTDVPVLRSIFYQTRMEDFPWCSHSIINLFDFDEETNGELILVAEVGCRPAGYLSLSTETGFVHHLFIAKKFRGQGIGSALLTEAAKSSSRTLSLKCMAENKNALRFYRTKGFVSEGEGICAEGPWIFLQVNDS